MIKIFISEKKDSSIDEFMQERKINNVVYTENIHGSDVAIVDKESSGKKIKGKDALITGEEDLYLCTTVADCLPIFLWNKEIIALAHGGWRGINLGIVSNVVRKMKEISSEEISAYIGPGIGKCHFEVQNDVASNFFGFTEERDGKIFVDLREVVKKTLNNEGILDLKINNECTYCSNRYFSYRRDKSNKRMFAFIGIKNK